MNELSKETALLWEKVSKLTPKLRKHIHIYTHTYREQRWYVLHDKLSGEHLRINDRAYSLVGRLNGKSSINTIYEHLQEHDKHDLDCSEILEVISKLHSINALSQIADKSVSQLLEQYRSHKRNVRLRRWLSPLTIRIPLVDPDALLDRSIVRMKPLFNYGMLLFWIAIVCVAGIACTVHWDLIATELKVDVLKPKNVLLLWLLYPLMKLLHEFAHAICVKRWGGEVHEMGITLLLFMPIPYVDASAASSFSAKRKRMLVSAVGIMAELLMASLALFLWLIVEPGLVKDCAFGVFLIGAFSTVVFNANPLLKFDGYYFLQDWIEIPNLMSRSVAYYRYLIKRYIVKANGITSPCFSYGERLLLVFYGFFSSLYRLFITFVIVLYLANKYLIFGVILGIWVLIQQFVMPLVQGVSYILNSKETTSTRKNTLRFLILSSILACLVVVFVPLPQTSQVQGVLSVPEQGEIFSPITGFIESVKVQPGTVVEQGQDLLHLHQPELERSILRLQGEIRFNDIKAELIRAKDPVEYALIQQDIAINKVELNELLRQRDQLTITAKTKGTFTTSINGSLQGRYYKQGELIAYIVDPSKFIVRVVVPENEGHFIQSGVKNATVMLAESIPERWEASLVNVVPGVDRRLPSAALGVSGGGDIAIERDGKGGVMAVDNLFHLHFSLPKQAQLVGVGERAYVTLKLKSESLARRWKRLLQQIFMSHLPA